MSPAKLIIHTFPNREEQAAACAKQASVYLAEYARRQGRAVAALAGGQTPRLTYQLLGGMTDNAPLWDKTDIYPTDERCSDEKSRRNDIMIRNALGAQAQVHSLREDMRAPELHVLLLGMGEDGHIASLFADVPDDESGQSDILKIRRIETAHAPEARLTFPLESLAASEEIILLTTGEKKRRLLDAPMPPLSALLAARQKQVHVYHAE